MTTYTTAATLQRMYEAGHLKDGYVVIDRGHAIEVIRAAGWSIESETGRALATTAILDGSWWREQFSNEWWTVGPRSQGDCVVVDGQFRLVATGPDHFTALVRAWEVWKKTPDTPRGTPGAHVTGKVPS